ncbi:MAG: leucine-rich repeat domain-containing protein [Pseudomonadota bacterium]
MPLGNEPPSPDLLKELEDVAEKAREVAEALDRLANFGLPDGFPLEPLKLELATLVRLPKGTAEGCRNPLLIARNRIPTLRNAFFARERDVKPSETDDEAPPPLTRGMTLDVRLSELLIAVSSALTQYQQDAEIDLPDDTKPDPALKNPDSEDDQSPINNSLALEKALSEASRSFDDETVGDNKDADTLRRQLNDTKTENQLTRAELQMPTTRERWLTPILDRLRRAPEAIEATARLVRAAVIVGTPLAKRIEDFSSDGVKFIGEQIVKTTRSVEEAMQRWKEMRDAPKTPANLPADFDLFKIHEMIVAGVAPPQSWVPFIEDLDFYERNGELISDDDKPSDLAPLARLTALKSLDLDGCSAIDLTPLITLGALEILYLSSSQINDLTPVKHLQNLAVLNLYNSNVADIKPLKHLKNLSSLYLHRTQVADITPLKELDNLTALTLSNTQVADVASLKDVDNLIELHLGDTLITDVTPLKDLKNLSKLYLPSTQVTDFKPIKDLQHLSTLDLSHTQLEDIAPLKDLKNLTTLDLSDTLIADIGPLKGLKNLSNLKLADTKVADIAPLKDLENLSKLDLQYTQVHDIVPLKDLKNLLTLDLDATQVTDVTPLENLNNLLELDFRNTQVADITPLKELNNLERIFLQNTQVSQDDPVVKALEERGVEVIM